MATTNLDRDIRSRIDSFLNDLSAMVKASALDAVQSALGSSDAAPRRGPGRPRKSGAPAASAARTRGKRGKRSSEDVTKTADTILGYIKKNQGQRLEQISKGLGIPSKELKLPVQKLFAAKAIKTKGQKRGTMYFAK